LNNPKQKAIQCDQLQSTDRTGSYRKAALGIWLKDWF